MILWECRTRHILRVLIYLCQKITRYSITQFERHVVKRNKSAFQILSKILRSHVNKNNVRLSMKLQRSVQLWVTNTRRSILDHRCEYWQCLSCISICGLIYFRMCERTKNSFPLDHFASNSPVSVLRENWTLYRTLASYGILRDQPELVDKKIFLQLLGSAITTNMLSKNSAWRWKLL